MTPMNNRSNLIINTMCTILTNKNKHKINTHNIHTNEITANIKIILIIPNKLITNKKNMYMIMNKKDHYKYIKNKYVANTKHNKTK